MANSSLSQLESVSLVSEHGFPWTVTMVQTKNSRSNEIVDSESLAFELQKLEFSLKSTLEEQNKHVNEACQSNSLNIDKNAKAIGELNDLVLGLSVQLTKLVSEKSPDENSLSNLAVITRDKQNSHHFSSRLTKIDFPKFNGGDLKPWL